MQDSKLRKLLCSFGFLTILLTILLLLGKIFDPVRLGMVKYVTERDSYYVSLLDEPKDTIDVIAMGDSLSYGMINPFDFWEQKNITSYIAGKEGQVVPETYYELKSILKNQSPKVVVIETGVLIHDFSTEIYQTVYQSVYDTLPIMKYHELWKVMLGKDDSLTLDHFKGFEKRDMCTAYTDGEYMIPTDEVQSINLISRIYLKKIKKLCDENDIQLILVSMPSPFNYNYEIHNGLEEISKDYGITYLDLNLMTEEIGFDWNVDMLDENDHVSFSGTKKTGSFLLEYMVENCGITGRTDDEVVKDWNEEAEKFRDYFE